MKALVISCSPVRTGATAAIAKLVSEQLSANGYGTTGLKMTLEIARGIVPEDEIYLCVNKDNIASQRVMLKNGARITGEDEAHIFMRIQK